MSPSFPPPNRTTVVQHLDVSERLEQRLGEGLQAERFGARERTEQLAVRERRGNIGGDRHERTSADAVER